MVVAILSLFLSPVVVADVGIVVVGVLVVMV